MHTRPVINGDCTDFDSGKKLRAFSPYTYHRHGVRTLRGPSEFVRRRAFHHREKGKEEEKKWGEPGERENENDCRQRQRD